jgi:anionic cell wall polymer biosynthesis LytR-Cps2A-Psr (LCP) family protein
MSNPPLNGGGTLGQSGTSGADLSHGASPPGNAQVAPSPKTPGDSFGFPVDFDGPFGDGPSEIGDGHLLIRKKRRRKRRKKRGLRALRGVLGPLAVLVVAGGLITLIVFGMVRFGEAAFKGDTSEAGIEVGEGAVTYDEGKTVSYAGHTYALNEDMVSVLIIGFDRSTLAAEGGPAGQADAVMVMALDTQSGKASVIAVPRDSMVDVDEFVGDAFIGQDTIQLCLAYSYGDGREQSCDNTLTAVSRILYNMPISYYFALDESGLAPLNDAIGGVALTPLQDIPGTSIVEGADTVLFGNNAYRYVQWRDTAALNSSIDRQTRQVQYVKAFGAKTLQLAQDEGNAGVLIGLLSTVGDYSISNLGANELGYLASAMLANDVTGLDMVTLGGEMVQGEVYAEYYLDKNAVYETVLDVYYRQVD